MARKYIRNRVRSLRGMDLFDIEQEDLDTADSMEPKTEEITMKSKQSAVPNPRNVHQNHPLYTYDLKKKQKMTTSTTGENVVRSGKVRSVIQTFNPYRPVTNNRGINDRTRPPTEKKQGRINKTGPKL